MIRIFGFISASLVFLLLGSLIVLIPGQASAWGCCTGKCKITCTCIGTYPCAYDPGDDKTVHSTTEINGGPSQMDIAHEAPAFTVTTLGFTDSFSELTTAGKCFRDKLALGLLANVQASLKFVTFLTDADK